MKKERKMRTSNSVAFSVAYKPMEAALYRAFGS